jgi:hypothetical protein
MTAIAPPERIVAQRPGTPMWRHHVDGQSREELICNLRRAQRIS